MPRIDPAQLLNCLQVLLSPTGGILSEEEVHRLASLMTKFSKKLVSKCVYVLILKNTEKHLLNLFMGCGGWTLIQLWLHDSMYSSNWILIKELLELLILTPVDVERLKSNNIPKLVKSLSKRDDLEGVCRLASQLVQQWLKIVKDETQSEQQRLIQAAASSTTITGQEDDGSKEPEHVDKDGPIEPPISTKSFYKLSLKDNKQTLNRLNSSEANTPSEIEEAALVDQEVVKVQEKEKAKDEKKHEKSKHRSSSSSSKSSKSSHKDRHNNSSSSSSSTTSSSRSKNRDKSKDKDRHHSSSRDKHRDKDKHRSNGTVSSSSKSKHKDSKADVHEKHESKGSKEKQIEKDRDTLHQLQPQSIQKLPKIPKKTPEEKDKEIKADLQKGSISIEVRKSTEERPKTVKVYKSKMRSTGLEEEAKPAPPRMTKKPGNSLPLPPVPLPTTPSIVVPVKRPSPIREVSGMPPEKKTKIDAANERPGAIKLIPPKPKPAVLQESDMFMDALTAATTKKEPKKRKRRTSASKEPGASSPPHSPTGTSAAPATSPIGIKNIVAPRFYQDTLQTDDSKTQTDTDNNEVINENVTNDTPEITEELVRSSTPVEENEEDKSASEVHVNSSGLKSVLVYTRRKGPKKSIKWKADDELVDVRYFELDESERVNVTRAFGDMAKMDVRGEREALQLSRKLQNDDIMEAQTVWKVPTEIDLPPPLIVPGSKSFERDIQFAREKSVLQALYFNKRMVPDSPAEPDPENYQIKDPIPIPVEDADNPDHDFRNTPYPEPKGSPPRPPVQNNPPLIFHNTPQSNFQNISQQPQQNFPNLQQPMKPNNVPPPLQFPNPQSHFVPQQQNLPGPDWNARNMAPNMPPNMQMMQPNMPPPVQVPPMNPMYLQPPDHFHPGANEVNHRFPGPFNPSGPPHGMFPINTFNPRPNRGNRGRGNPYGGFHRGGNARGGGGGSWMRMNGPPQNTWHKNPRGHHRRGGGGNYVGNAEMY